MSKLLNGWSNEEEIRESILQEKQHKKYSNFNKKKGREWNV
jgi:hypothetical protein